MTAIGSWMVWKVIGPISGKYPLESHTWNFPSLLVLTREYSRESTRLLFDYITETISCRPLTNCDVKEVAWKFVHQPDWETGHNRQPGRTLCSMKMIMPIIYLQWRWPGSVMTVHVPYVCVNRRVRDGCVPVLPPVHPIQLAKHHPRTVPYL